MRKIEKDSSSDSDPDRDRMNGTKDRNGVAGNKVWLVRLHQKMQASVCMAPLFQGKMLLGRWKHELLHARLRCALTACLCDIAE